MNLSVNLSRSFGYLAGYLSGTKNWIVGVAVGLGISMGTIPSFMAASAQTNTFIDRNVVGRWQVKFPTADTNNPDIEVAITSDGKIYYLDKVKGEAIEILTLLEKVSDRATIPDTIKIIDIQAQAKAEAIARQIKRLQTEAQTVLSTIHLAHTEYFSKNKEFSSKLEDLGFGTEISSEVFSYKIEAIDPKFIVQTVAITKELKDRVSVIGINTFIVITYLTQASTGKEAIASLICQGNQKVEQPMPKARFIKIGDFIKDIKCPVGFTPISP